MATDDELIWLKQAISKGLMGLVVLHLDGGPSAETVTKTAGVWFHVMKSWPIVWNESLDRERLRDAFTTLAGQSKRWPSPSELRLLMPARQYPQAVLPEPEYPPEKAKKNREAIREIRALAERRADLLRQLECSRSDGRDKLRQEIADIEQKQRELYR